MRRVLLLGAGAVGARAARHLSADGDVELRIHDLRVERATSVANALGPGAEISADGEDDCDVAVLALPAGSHAERAAELARRGVAVVSTSDAVADVRALLDLDAEATERGVAVIAGAAFSPGLTCLLAAHAGTMFDDVDEVHVARAGTGGPACARQHHAALSGAAIDWRDGGWMHRTAGSGRELCWFPDPIGARDCYRAALSDPLLLVRAFPNVERVTARLAANRRDRMTAQLPMLRPPHAEGGPGAVRVEVRGNRGGARTVVVYGAMDVPATAAGAVAAEAARAIVAGRVPPGVHGLAGIPDALPILKELARHGIKAARFTGEQESAH
jgi:predicted dinucleotide-binding enzyme